VASTHALASHLRDARQQVAVPAAAPLAGEIDKAMSELVHSIRTGEPPRHFPDLRRAHRRLSVGTAQGQALADRRGAIMAALLDPLVDGIDTAADLLSGSGGERRTGSDGRSPTLLPSRVTGPCYRPAYQAAWSNSNFGLSVRRRCRPTSRPFLIVATQSAGGV